MPKGKVTTTAHVSIHAPARGATPLFRQARFIFVCFNSRAREGRDA